MTSEPGIGTIFRVQLSDFPVLMKPRILIVEDDEEIRTQLKWTLTGEYDLLVAGDRAEATRLFRAQQPATVLLDLGLPPAP